MKKGLANCRGLQGRPKVRECHCWERLPPSHDVGGDGSLRCWEGTTTNSSMLGSCEPTPSTSGLQVPITVWPLVLDKGNRVRGVPGLGSRKRGDGGQMAGGAQTGATQVGSEPGGRAAGRGS